ncbi:MAG: rRNA maturation RNase YbeY [Chitinophagaceae bacterium]
MRKEKSIQFHFLKKVYLTNRTCLRSFLVKFFKQQGKKVSIVNYIFCSNQYLLKINRKYLCHYSYTDIITFELSEKDAPLVADIFISVERIAENKGHFNTTLKTELHRVIFHGALHLCGYSDKTVNQTQQMREAENDLLKTYFSFT